MGNLEAALDGAVLLEAAEEVLGDVGVGVPDEFGGGELDRLFVVDLPGDVVPEEELQGVRIAATVNGTVKPRRW